MGRFQRATAEAVAQSEKALSFELAVPPGAKRSRKEPRDARWTERIQVTEVTTEETTSQKGDDHLLCIVAGLIIDGETPSENNGRTVSFRGRLNYEAFNKGDRKDKQLKMHERTMGNLSQLLRATGLYDGGEISEELLDEAFPLEGASPMMGQTLDVEIHQGPNDDGRIFPEISAFTVGDGGGAVGGGVAATSDALSL